MSPAALTPSRHELLRRALEVLQEPIGARSPGARVPPARSVVLVGPPGIGRTTLLDHATAALERAGRAVARRVHVVDDLQHLDGEARRRLISEMGRGGRRVLASVPDRDPLAPELLELAAGEQVELITVPPLPEHEIAGIAAALLGLPLDSLAASRLGRWSGGIPGDLIRCLDAARATGSIRYEAGVLTIDASLPVTPELAAWFESCLAAVPSEHRHVLELVAVAGSVADAVLRRRRSRLAHELERHHLLRSSDTGGRGSIRWLPTSSLFGELARWQLGPEQRAERLAELASLITLGRRQTLAEPERLNLGRWHATHEVCSEVCAAAVLHALHVAYAVKDLEALDDLATAAYERDGVWEAGFRLAELAEIHGRRAVQGVLTAQLLERCSSDRERFLATMLHASHLSSDERDIDGAAAVLEEQGQRATDPVWRSHFTARQLAYLADAGHLAQVEARGALLLDDPLVATHAAVYVGFGRTLGGRTADALAAVTAGERALELVGEMHPAFTQLLRTTASASYLMAGDLETAEAACRVAYDDVVRVGDRYPQSWYALALGNAALTRGAVASARRWFGDATAGFASMRQSVHLRWAASGLAMASALAGDRHAAAAARATARRAAHPDYLLHEPECRRQLAWLSVVDGDLKAAGRDLAEAAEMAGQTGQHALELLALHDLARIGDPQRAAAMLSPGAQAVDGTLLPARLAHLLALAEGSRKDIATAVHALERSGQWLVAAEGWAGLARTADDEREAAGARRRALAALSRTEGACSPLVGAIPRPGLGPTVRTVADLAAAGLRQDEIAEATHLSRATVRSHLRRTYQALGVHRSEELPEALAEHDLALHERPSPAPETGQVVLPSGTLVGRQRELRHVRDLVLAGADDAIVVIGPAGIGKTHLVTAVERSCPPGRVEVVDDADRLGHDELAVLRHRLGDGHATRLLTARRRLEPGALGAARLVEVTLGPLDVDEVGWLAARLLQGIVLRSTAATLHHVCGGNPLWLIELLHTAVRDGTLIREDGVWVVTVPLDDRPKVRDLVARRIACLDEATRATLARLATSGPLPEDLAPTVLDPGGLASLAAQGLVIRGSGELRIAHPLYADAAEPYLTAAQRRQWLASLHRAAGRAQQVPADRLLAWSLAAGERPGTRTLVGAARRALEEGRLDEALARAHAAREQAAGDGAHEVLGEIHEERGELDAAATAYGRAAAAATSSAAARRISRRYDDLLLHRRDDLDLMHQVQVVGGTRHRPRAPRSLWEADLDELGRSCPDPEAAMVDGRRLGQVGRSLAAAEARWLAGQPSAAVQTLRKLDELPRVHAAPAWRAEVVARLARAHALAGQTDHAERTMHRLGDDQRVSSRRARAWTDAARHRRTDGARQLGDLARDLAARGHLRAAITVLHDVAVLGGDDHWLQPSEDLDPSRLDPAAQAITAHVRALRQGEPDELHAAAECLAASGLRLAAAQARRAAATIAGGYPVATDPSIEDVALQVLGTPAGASRLTPRQRAIAELAAQGWTSRRIAEHLGVTHRTVENHLQHVYQRLGIGRRADLARSLAAAEAGMRSV